VRIINCYDGEIAEAIISHHAAPFVFVFCCLHCYTLPPTLLLLLLLLLLVVVLVSLPIFHVQLTSHVLSDVSK